MVNNKINVNVIDGLQPILDRVIDYDNITNCITEIPQDIKLELNNGTLTLKAGSKVYVPNGKNADGSLKFDEVVSKNDISSSSSWTSGQVIMIPQKGLNSGIYSSQISNHYSGSTEPTTKYDGTIWYDTANNLIKRYNGSNSEWEGGLPFPFCISTMTSGVGLTSIDQVFNGFGYIGSTVFALPGVKGLIPNGRNADGKLKNLEFIAKNVSISTMNDLNRNGVYLTESMKIERFPTTSYRFDEKENIHYNISDNTLRLRLLIGTIEGNITSFNPNFPFKAVDQNDFNKLDEEAVKTSGYQIINGDKIFTGQIIKAASSSTPMMTSRQNHVTLGTNPSANTNTYIASEDKSGADQSYIAFEVRTDGSGVISLGARNNSSSDRASSGIQVARKLDGTSWTSIGTTTASAPTPATTDNSTKIATTAFFRNNMQVVETLPSTATNGVFYFVKE